MEDGVGEFQNGLLSKDIIVNKWIRYAELKLVCDKCNNGYCEQCFVQDEIDGIESEEDYDPHRRPSVNRQEVDEDGNGGRKDRANLKKDKLLLI